MVSYSIVDTGDSRSFPEDHPFLAGAGGEGEVVAYIGSGAITAWQEDPSRTAILVELTTETLGEVTGESRGEEGSNTIGFARFRVGDGAPRGGLGGEGRAQEGHLAREELEHGGAPQRELRAERAQSERR